MRILPMLVLSGATALCACAAPTAPPSAAILEQQVGDTERAFAKTMADRDHAAFTAFLSDEAVFDSGDKVLRGRQAVADAWQRLFAKPAAPFSWEPDQVEVLDSGTLAMTSGPVRDASGKVVARFRSIWRREAPGVWRIVFDSGCDVCACEVPR